MKFITCLVATLVALFTASSCASPDAPRVEQSPDDSAEEVTASESEGTEAEANEPARAEQNAPPFAGCWIAAEDPTGQVVNEGLYTNSRVRFAEDGGYTFALGSGQTAIRGTWEMLSHDGDTITYRAVYSGGRATDPITLTLRRADDAVVGIVIRDASGPRHYSRSEDPDSRERGCGAPAREPHNPPAQTSGE